MLLKSSLKQSHDLIGLFSTMLLAKQQFDSLEIWNISIEIAEQVCNIADQLEKLQMSKYSEYMKRVCMGICNHIAEISGKHDEQIVKCSLTNAHLLALESENIIMILYEYKLLDTPIKDSLLIKIQMLADKILDYQHHLNENRILKANYD